LEFARFRVPAAAGALLGVWPGPETRRFGVRGASLGRFEADALGFLGSGAPSSGLGAGVVGIFGVCDS